MTEPEQWAVELWHRFHRAYLMEYCESHQQGVQSAALTIQRAFEERTGQLIPAPSVDDARITALEASLAEAEGRVIAEVVAWLEARSLRQDTVSSVLVLAEAATALETGAWKKDSPPPSTV